MTKCEICGKEAYLYQCSYCELYFCDEHRLPEQHNCAKLPERDWDSYRNEAIKMGRVRVEENTWDVYRRNMEKIREQPMIEDDGAQKEEFIKDTGSSFTRKEENKDVGRPIEKPANTGAFIRDTGSSFIRREEVQEALRRQNERDVSPIFPIFAIVVLVLAVIAVLLGYIK